MHVTTNPRTLKEKKKETREIEDELIIWQQDLINLCSTLSGRKVVWRILGKLKFIDNVGNARREETERNIGKQEVGNWLFNELIEADERIFFTMITENKKGMYNGNARNKLTK